VKEIPNPKREIRSIQEASSDDNLHRKKGGISIIVMQKKDLQIDCFPIIIITCLSPYGSIKRTAALEAPRRQRKLFIVVMYGLAES